MAFYRHWWVFSILVAFATSLHSQNHHDFGFIRSQNIAVHSFDEQLFLFPWTGGINGVSLQIFNLDGDAFDDLILFEKHGNRILPFVNNGIADSASYTFAPEYAHYFPDLHDWVIFKDFDNDGRIDIFTYGTAGITVYRNTSEGEDLQFELVTSQIQSEQFGNLTNLYASPDDYLAIEDVDGDGDLDILNFWLLGKYVHFHRNISMEEYGDYSHLEFRLEDECWGHFEEGGEDNTILLNSSCGQKDEPSRHVGSTIAVKDLTGNGLPDMILGDIDFPNLVYLQNGGTLQDAMMVAQDTAFPNPTQPIRLFSMPVLNFVDVDNDGEEELIASPADPVLNKSKDANSVWMYQKSTQSFQYEKVTESFLQNEMIDVGSGAAPVLYDWDQDGLLDLFIGNYGSYDTSTYNNGFLTSAFSSSISYYRNIGTQNTPEFQLVTNDFGSLRTYAYLGLHPTFGDVDGNGTIDMMCGMEDGKVALFVNRSTLPEAPDFAPADFTIITEDFGDYAKPQLFDLDRDGREDLLVGNRRGHIAYLRNTSTNQNIEFQLVTDTLGGVDVRDAQTSYFGFCAPTFFRNATDNTVLFCGNEKGEICYYDLIDNNLNGSFRLRETALLENDDEPNVIDEGIRSVPAVADLNSDGYIDLLVGNYAGGVTLFLGTTPPLVSIPDFGNADTPLAIRVFPQPATNHFTIDCPKPLSGILRIYDACGQLVFSQAICRQQSITINSNFNAGIYIGTIISANGSGSFKVIVRR